MSLTPSPRVSVPGEDGPSKTNTMNGEAVKMVVIGDGTVGKTCLCVVYKDKRFPEEYVPTVFESSALTQMWKGKVCSISQ